MASSRTGLLNRAFLDSTYTIARTITPSANRTEANAGYEKTLPKHRKRNNRPRKGSVTHDVRGQGTITLR